VLGGVEEEGRDVDDLDAFGLALLLADGDGVVEHDGAERAGDGDLAGADDWICLFSEP